jgi:chromosome partitioning protein
VGPPTRGLVGTPLAGEVRKLLTDISTQQTTSQPKAGASDGLNTPIATDPRDASAIGPTQRPIPSFPDPEPLTTHGPARVVSVCNQKGGVGKTTTTINLGAALAEQGRRVLLVDFDPQGALSVGLGKGDPRQLELTIHNLLLERNVEFEDVVLETNVDGMDLLPSNIDLSGAEVQLVHEVGREYILSQVIKPAIPLYDYILIDCQPSLGLLTINALAASQGVLVPLECEYFAMRGVALLMETIDKVQGRINPGLEIDGFLGTMYDSRTLHTREVLGRIVEAFGEKVFHTVINRTVRFPDATVVGEPITTFDPSSMGANAYRELAKEVLDRWRRSAA